MSTVRWLGARPLPQPARAGRAVVDVRPAGDGAIIEVACAHVRPGRSVTDVDQAIRDAAAVVLGVRFGCTCGERLIVPRRN